MRKVSLVLVVVLCAVLVAGVGCDDESSSSGGGKTTPVSTSTPLDTLKTVQEIFVNKDFETLVDVFDPKLGKVMGEMTATMGSVVKKADEVAAAVEAKFGAEKAEMFRKRAGIPSKLDTPMDRATGPDGQVDWSKVEIMEEGDVAKFKVAGRLDNEMVLRKVDGKWYLSPAKPEEMEGEKMQQEVANMKEMSAKLLAAMDAVNTAVDDGTLTEENFSTKLPELLKSGL